MSEPKNHTTIVICNIQGVAEDCKLFYRNYSRFEYLPMSAKSPEVRKEYDAWWKWYSDTYEH